jgi:hypothetical protein
LVPENFGLLAVFKSVNFCHEFVEFRGEVQPEGVVRAAGDHKLIPFRRPKLTTKFPGEGRPSLSIDSRLGMTYERRKVHTSF